MQYHRILAIGDIHGMYDKLFPLMDKIKFNPQEDLLLFLGDYIDRGNDSIRCLSYIMNLQKKYPNRVICLMGNHEWMFYYSFMDTTKEIFSIDDVSIVWLQNGGYKTYQQIISLPNKKRNEILQWVGKLPLHYQIDKFYFCHAGIHPFVSLDKQQPNHLLWIREYFFEEYDGDETIVVGHTPTQRMYRYYNISSEDKSKPIFTDNHIILCDTGAYKKDGKLSCVDVLSKEFWQA